MTDLRACCGNCNAWLKEIGDRGACRALPPTVLLIGHRQEKVAMRLPGQPPVSTQPVVGAYFPPMMAKGWCRQWEPTAETEQAFRDASNGQAHPSEADATEVASARGSDSQGA